VHAAFLHQPVIHIDEKPIFAIERIELDYLRLTGMQETMVRSGNCNHVPWS